MATALFDNVNRAASRQFRRRAKTTGVVGPDVVPLKRALAWELGDYVGVVSRRYQRSPPHADTPTRRHADTPTRPLAHTAHSCD
jgi:hypothetical protein